MTDEPIADVVARVLYQREMTTRQLLADAQCLATEVQRLTEQVGETQRAFVEATRCMTHIISVREAEVARLGEVERTMAQVINRVVVERSWRPAADYCVERNSAPTATEKF